MSDKSNNANGKGTPLPRAKIRISEHYNALVKSYTSEQSDRATIMASWLAKRPKPYGVVYHPMYRFSKLSLGVLHLVSFICAVSVVGFIQSLNLGTQGMILSAIAVLFLAICEFGQHSTLNVACNIYHQSGAVPSRIKFIALLFSLVSIVSSAFGTYHFVQTYEMKGNALLYGIILVSLVNEILIIYNTIDIHKYEKACYDESMMINDLTYENGQSTLFTSTPPPPTLKTTMVGESPEYQRRLLTPDRGPGIIKKISESKNEKVNPFEKIVDSKPVITKKPIEKVKTKVFTSEVKDTVPRVNPKSFWSKDKVREKRDKYKRSYEKSPTHHQKVRYTYFQYALDNFDKISLNGTLRIVPKEAQKWYTNRDDKTFYN